MFHIKYGWNNFTIDYDQLHNDFNVKSNLFAVSHHKIIVLFCKDTKLIAYLYFFIIFGVRFKNKLGAE